MRYKHSFLAALALLAFTGVALAKMDFEIKPADRTLGNPKAKVTLIEYAAFTCPHCAAINEQVFPEKPWNRRPRPSHRVWRNGCPPTLRSESGTAAAGSSPASSIRRFARLSK